MLIDTSTMVPWKSNDHNENLLIDFLNQGCFWKGAFEYGKKEEFFVAYSKFCYQRGTTSEARGMTEMRLQRLSHEVTRDGIRGIFVRTGSEAPASAAQPVPTLSQKLSTAVTPELISANNEALEPEQPKEIVFTSAKGAM